MQTEVTKAVEYYTLISEKNAEAIQKYLHPDVEFQSPLASLKGKEAVLKAVSNFMNAFHTLKIRSQLGAKNQAMIVYDTDIPGISKSFPGASLLNFKDGMIIRIELFFDATRFSERK